MNDVWRFAGVIVVLCAAAARVDGAPVRPDVNSKTPLAKCKLLPVTETPATNTMQVPANVYLPSDPIDDPLANYERTELGNWRMPGDAELNDPWIRLLVVGPKRPVVVDVAVFVDGKTFREVREAWIDELIASPATKPSAETPTPSEEPTSGNKSTESAGTESEASASNAEKSESAGEEGNDEKQEQENEKVDGDKEGDKDQSKDGDEENATKEPATPSVTAQSRQLPMIRDRLANYLAANGTSVDRNEIGWLIAEWGSGPALVVLEPALSWQRAGVAMLESLVDEDADGNLSAQETAGIEETMRRADLDANEVVDMSEIRRATSRESANRFKIGNPMVVILDSNTDWESLTAVLSSVYSRAANSSPAADSTAPIKDRLLRGDADLTSDAVRELANEPADISLRVDFGADKDSVGLAILAAAPEFTSVKDGVTATDNVITVGVGSDYLEITAAGSAGQPGTPSSDGQIAVGAVIDGNPLLRVLDQDQDQRLTLRERQSLKGLLTALDRDSDGNLAGTEMPVPMRLAITLGPHVHELLAKPTGAARAIAPSSDPAPPDWFASMDKNSDRDLSREEFLGTTEQFKQFDTDSDGLLNVAESLKVGGGK